MVPHTTFNTLPAPRGAGFIMDGYWVWCGSCARGDDGRYHLFASRWPNAYPMHPGWVFHSEIVRAEADRPEGPYTFKEVVLPRRDSGYFDGMATHNPSIQRCGDTWLLFYTGITYPFNPPGPENFPKDGDPIYALTWGMKRIGLATAPSPEGPWTRQDSPLLEPRSGKWDNGVDWNIQGKAYSREIVWDDGTPERMGSLERPCLLFDRKGKPTHLFAATGSGPGGFHRCPRTWNMVIPLR